MLRNPSKFDDLKQKNIMNADESTHDKQHVYESTTFFLSFKFVFIVYCKQTTDNLQLYIF